MSGQAWDGTGEWNRTINLRFMNQDRTLFTMGGVSNGFSV